MKYYMWLTGLSIAVHVSPSMAGDISITTKAVCEDGTLTVTLKNLGTEQANDVTIEVLGQGERLVSPNSLPLAPAGIITERFSLEPASMPGTHCVRLIVTYRDMAGYLFSAPTAVLTRNGNEGNSKCSIHLEIPRHGLGKGTMQLINLERAPVDVKGSLFTATELAVTPESFNVRLAPGERRTTEFEVKNIGAIPVARYPLYVITGYNKDGVHHAAVGNGMIRIDATGGVPWRIVVTFVGAIAVCGAMLGTRLFKRPERSTPDVDKAARGDAP